MPLPSLSAALAPNPDIEKTALYPRQAKCDQLPQDEPKKEKKGWAHRLSLFDLLKSDGSGESKMASSSALTAALSSPEKPAGNVNDMLTYWQTVTKAAKAEQQTLSHRVDTVFKNVKMQGFKQVSNARTKRAKIFWFVMLFVIVTTLSFEIYQCVNAYWNSPVTTKFTISTPPVMNFPKVYICYGNAINRTYMLEHADMMSVAAMFRNRDAVTKGGHNRKRRDAAELFDEQDMMDILSRSARDTDDNGIFDDTFDGFDSMEDEEVVRKRRDVFVSAANRSLEAELQANRTKAAQLAAMKARLEALMSSPNISDVIYEYYLNAGFKIDETFLECGFRGYKEENLTCRDIIRPVVDSNYFLCYIVDLPDDKKQTVAGKGLSLVLNSHVNLYPQEAAVIPPRYHGIVVSVDKEFNPFNWEKTCITSGRVTKIDLAMTHVHLEDFDSGPLIQHCFNDEQAKNVYKIFKSNYTRTTCQMDCLFQSHRNHCQCLMLADKGQIRDDVLNDTGFCSPKQLSECVAHLPDDDVAQKAVNECLAHCHPPCESYRYDMRPSYAEMHDSAYTRFKLPENVTAKQLIDLRIAFSRLEYAELIQQPSASFADLVANMGGQINLWMGASLISMLEMVFMAIGLVVWSCYVKGFKPGQKNVDQKKV